MTINIYFIVLVSNRELNNQEPGEIFMQKAPGNSICFAWYLKFLIDSCKTIKKGRTDECSKNVRDL